MTAPWCCDALPAARAPGRGGPADVAGSGTDHGGIRITVQARDPDAGAARPQRRRVYSRAGPTRAEPQDLPVPPTEHDTASSPLLETVDLSCFRGDRPLFEGLSIQVARGEVVQVHGPNGSGKTTLLRVLCGLQPPAGGSVRWQGRDVPPGAPELRAGVQYVGHAAGVKLDLTPRENLAVAVALGAGPAGTTVDAALARLEIDRFHDVPARALSAGQRQRVALARLLTCAAALWVLDEPFTALDARAAALAGTMLREHTGAGGAAVIASHHPVAPGGVTPRLVRIGPKT